MLEGRVEGVEMEEDGDVVGGVEGISDKVVGMIGDRRVEMGGMNRVNRGKIRGRKVGGGNGVEVEFMWRLDW